MTTQPLDAPYDGGQLRLIAPSPVLHAATGLVWVSDPEVGRYMGEDFSRVSLDTERLRLHDMLTSDDEYAWMIEFNGTVIGAIELNQIAQASASGIKSARFSTIIGDKTYWGQKIAPAAKRAVMAWAFTDGEFERLIAWAQLANERSWHSLASLGFQYRGTKTDPDASHSGTWRMYDMTKPRWLELGR